MVRRLLHRAQPRSKDAIHGRPLALPAAATMRYSHRLEALSDRMTLETKREIEALFRHPDVRAYIDTFAFDISPASQARILTNKLKQKFEQLFGEWAKPYADDWMDQTNKSSASALGMSLRDISADLALNTGIITGGMSEFMKATIAQNVSLIKSIPSEYFRKVQGEVLRSLTTGKGLEDLTPFFENQEGITKRRARNIATDQTNKAYNGLNKGRMQAVGVAEYEWIHSGGSVHPRPMHIAMSGQIYRFDNPPVIEEDGERGIPGQAINCHCTMSPVVRFAGDKDQRRAANG